MSTESQMEIDETSQNEVKTEKAESKLPFSIENLLSDKFKKKSPVDDNPSTSGCSDYFKINDDDTDDEKSDDSENVDVEGSTADAQEFVDKNHDYQQTGRVFNTLINEMKILYVETFFIA